MAFLFSLLLILAVVAAGIGLVVISVFAICAVKERLDDFAYFRKIEYDKAYHRGKIEGAKYPMGINTFPIACSHCANLGSDKCYRCKEEIVSGFEMKKE